MHHTEYAKSRKGLSRPCTAHDANFGGGCFNCGYDPATLDAEYQKRCAEARDAFARARSGYDGYGRKFS